MNTWMVLCKYLFPSKSLVFILVPKTLKYICKSINMHTAINVIMNANNFIFLIRLVCRKFIQNKSTGDSSAFPFICGFLS